MVNKLVNLRLNDKLLKAVDGIVKETTFSSRSEFIKEAIRDRIDEYRQRELLRKLRKQYGEGKRLGIKEPSDEDLKKARERLGKLI